MNGCSGYRMPSFLLILEYPGKQSILFSLKFRVCIYVCHLPENWHNNELNCASRWIKFMLWCNRFMNICESRWGGAKQYRKRVQIKWVFPHPIYKLELRCGLMPAIYKLPALLQSCVGNAWEPFVCVGQYPLILMSCSYLHQYESIELNPLYFWTW
jgi:hypothetical protein